MATAWRKLIYSGSNAELNNLDVLKASGSFSGSFQGEVLGTIDSASVSTLSQTASVALRANALAPTVTATSASTAIAAQTASVALRANALAPTATASFADSATTASHTAGTASIANIATYTSEWILGANGSSDYTFTGPGFTGSAADPDIYLIRGQQYKFTNNLGAHPFRIQTTVNGSAGTQYNNGVTNNDVSSGTLTFNVPMEAPEVLYYQCTSHAAMGGPIYILDTSPVSSSFATSASIATTSQTSSVALRANALSPLATASNADTATSASRAATGDGIFSGSFSGSYQGDGSNLTGLATTLTVDGDSGTQDVSLTADDLQILGTAQEITTAVTKVGNDVKVTLSLPDDVTIGNNLTVTNDATIAGDLVVGGSIVSASSLAVEDQFIILASGSNGAIDGGIIINQIDDDPDGKGQAFAYDSSANRWALETGLNDSASVITPDAYMGVIQEASGVPSSNPLYGGTAGKGTIYVNTSNEDIYIYS